MDKDYVERQSIKLVVEWLKPNTADFIGLPNGQTVEPANDNGVTLAQFIQALQGNTHRKWRLYKLAFSEIAGRFKNGRCGSPIKQTGPGGQMGKIFGRIYNREKYGTKYTPQLPLDKCKTVEQRIQLIMACETSPQVKADLISVLNL